MTDEEILEYQASTANAIVTKLNQARRQSPVTAAIELLLGRIVGAGNSLRVLRENAPHDFAFDGAMILRGIYDAMLQSLYILVDEPHGDERAQLYLDFFWIEKKKAIELFDNSPTYLGKRISQGFLLMDLAWRFSFRVLGPFSVFANVALDKHESELVRHSEGNVFGDPSTPLPVNLPGRGSS